jgi:hypothetical protein
LHEDALRKASVNEVLRTDYFGKVEGLSERWRTRDAVLAQRAPQALTLLAEAGHGQEPPAGRTATHPGSAHRVAPLGVPRLLARAQPAGLGQPYRLLRDMLAHRLQIADGDSADNRARQRFEQG